MIEEAHNPSYCQHLTPNNEGQDCNGVELAQQMADGEVEGSEC